MVGFFEFWHLDPAVVTPAPDSFQDVLVDAHRSLLPRFVLAAQHKPPSIDFRFIAFKCDHLNKLLQNFLPNFLLDRHLIHAYAIANHGKHRHQRLVGLIGFFTKFQLADGNELLKCGLISCLNLIENRLAFVLEALFI